MRNKFQINSKRWSIFSSFVLLLFSIQTYSQTYHVVTGTNTLLDINCGETSTQVNFGFDEYFSDYKSDKNNDCGDFNGGPKCDNSGFEIDYDNSTITTYNGIAQTLGQYGTNLPLTIGANYNGSTASVTVNWHDDFQGELHVKFKITKHSIEFHAGSYILCMLALGAIPANCNCVSQTCNNQTHDNMELGSNGLHFYKERSGSSTATTIPKLFEAFSFGSTEVRKGDDLNLAWDASYSTTSKEKYNTISKVRMNEGSTQLFLVSGTSGKLKNTSYNYNTTSLSLGNHTFDAYFSNSCNKLIGPISSTVKVKPSCDNQPNVNISVVESSSGATPTLMTGGYQLQENTEYKLIVNGLPDISLYEMYENGAGDIILINGFQSNGANSFYQKFKVSLKSPAIAGLYDIGIDLLNSFKTDPSQTYSGCVQSLHTQLGVNGANQDIKSNCLITIPNDLCSFITKCTSSSPIYQGILSNFTYLVTSKIGVLVKDGMVLKEGAHLIVNYTPPVNTKELADLNKLWTEDISYDEEGAKVIDNRQYMDAGGNPIQTQYKVFGSNAVIATETIYDQFWRPTIKTLSAPIRFQNDVTTDDCGNVIPINFGLYFSSVGGFVTNVDGQPYTADNFENTSSTNNKRNAPDPVDGSGENTLGAYYASGSDFVPVTSFPYTRSYSEEIGNKTISYATLPGDLHAMGQGHVVTTTITSLDIHGSDWNDLEIVTKYLTIYKDAFSATLPTLQTFTAQIIRKINKDTEGNIYVHYFDNESKALITRYLPTEDWAFNLYDIKGRLIHQISINGVDQYLMRRKYVSLTSPISFNDIDKTTYTYNFRGNLLKKKNIDGGLILYQYRTDGQIRFSQNAVQSGSSPKRFSYTNYDDLSRPVETGEYTLASGTVNDYLIFDSSNSNFSPSFLDATGDESNITTTSGVKSNVVKVNYDGENDPPYPLGFLAQYVIGRVSSTERDNGYTTWYSYDDLGRSVQVYQKIPGLGIKTIDYTYGKYGKVSKVEYQKNQSDGFAQFYSYDASGRIIEVSSLRPSQSLPQKEASYSYYLHGPLKEEVIAKDAINEQSRYYTYTPQGWLKSINHLAAGGGNGGINGQSVLFEEKLDYFEGDFGSNSYGFLGLHHPGSPMEEHFNGIPAGIYFYNAAHATQPYWANIYSYDAKYQLKNVQRAGITSHTYGYTTVNVDLPNQYAELVSDYDANGNILGLSRYDASSVIISNFAKYDYTLNTNKLSKIYDGSSPPSILKTYSYDATGRNTQIIDGANTTLTEYNISGQVTKVTRNNKTLQTLEYSDGGERYKQTVFDKNGIAIKETYYINDISGNSLAVYEKDLNVPLSGYNLLELPILGINRIGNIMISYDANGYSTDNYYYELTDHSGNVRVVFDRCRQQNNYPIVHYFSDYYAFGLPIVDRSSQGYRYAYQGQFAEYDKGTTGLYSFYWRNYDGEIGRWLSRDPFGQFFSPYVAMGNSPHANIDPDGGWEINLGISGPFSDAITRTTVFPAMKLVLSEVEIVASSQKNFKFPTFKVLWDNYPQEVKSLPGGWGEEINTSPNICSEGYENQCAIRMSYDLQKSGIDMGSIDSEKYPVCGHGHIKTAENVAYFIKDELKVEPEVLSYQGFVTKYHDGNTSGIVYYRFGYNRGIGTGHIDLFKANGSGGITKGTNYIMHPRQMQEIWFWPIK